MPSPIQRIEGAGGPFGLGNPRRNWSAEGLSKGDRNKLAARIVDLNTSTNVLIKGPEKRIDKLPAHLRDAVRQAQDLLTDHVKLKGRPKEARTVYLDAETGTLSIAGGDVTVDVNGNFVFAEHETEKTAWWTEKDERGKRRFQVTTKTPGVGFMTKVVIPDPESAEGKDITSEGEGMIGNVRILEHDLSAGPVLRKGDAQPMRIVTRAIQQAIETVYIADRKPETPDYLRGGKDVLVHRLILGTPRDPKDVDIYEATKKALAAETATYPGGVLLVLGDGASLDLLQPLDEPSTDAVGRATIDGLRYRWQVTGKEPAKKEDADAPKPVIISASPEVGAMLPYLTLSGLAASLHDDRTIITHGVKATPSYLHGFRSGPAPEQPKHTIAGSTMEGEIAGKAKEALDSVEEIRFAEGFKLSSLFKGKDKKPDATLLVIALEALQDKPTEIKGVIKTSGVDSFDFSSDDENVSNRDFIRAGNDVVVMLSAILAKANEHGLSSANELATRMLNNRYDPQNGVERDAIQALADILGPKTEDEIRKAGKAGRRISDRDERDGRGRRGGRRGGKDGRGSKNGRGDKDGRGSKDDRGDKDGRGGDGAPRRRRRAGGREGFGVEASPESLLAANIVATYAKRFTERMTAEEAYARGAEFAARIEGLDGQVSEVEKARLMRLLNSSYTAFVEGTKPDVGTGRVISGEFRETEASAK